MSEFEINGTPVHKLRVVDLKEELDARGLSKSGKKDELVARLVSFLEVNYSGGRARALVIILQEFLLISRLSGVLFGFQPNILCPIKFFFWENFMK